MQKYTAKELSMAKTRLRRNPDDVCIALMPLRYASNANYPS